MVFILLAFLLIIIALLIAVSIYCYLIKFKTKQKQLFPFCVANSELEVLEIYLKNGENVKNLILKIALVFILMIW